MGWGGWGGWQPTYFAFFFLLMTRDKEGMSNLRVQRLDRHGDQMTLRGLIQKAKLRAKHPNMIKIHWGGGGWGERGINKLSQIKPCSYCTLETCCHGGRGWREEENDFKGVWT